MISIKIEKLKLDNICLTKANFQNNVCKCTASYGCASMGYDAWSTQESATFYLQTAAAEPFCVS